MKKADLRVVIVLLLASLVFTFISPSRIYGASFSPLVKESLESDIAVDASRTFGIMPNIFRTGVIAVNEDMLLKGGIQYLQKKYYSDMAPGMTTIFVPLWSDSFDDYKNKVKREGVLVPAVHEAKKVLEGGGGVLFDLQIMPRWLSSNLSKGEFWRYPPRNYKTWKELVAYTVKYFKKSGLTDADYRIWEEADSGLSRDLKFWNGTKEEFYKLYQYSVMAIKSVNPGAGITFGNAHAHSDLFSGMIKYTAKNNLPLDYVLYHPFGVPPYTDDYKDVVKHIRDTLKKAGLNDNIPVHTESWNSWIEFGKPQMKTGQPDERSYERDTEYNSAYAVQTVYAQDTGGITHQAFFSRVDPHYERYRASGSTAGNLQFYGDWGMLTRNLVIKPVYNAFRMLSIVYGKKEHRASDRLEVLFDEHDHFTVIASRTQDKKIVRILLSRNIAPPSDRAGYYKKRIAEKYKKKYMATRYGKANRSFQKCKKRNASPGNCFVLFPPDIQPFMKCIYLERKGQECGRHLPDHFLDFKKRVTEYLEHSDQYAKTVNLLISNLPFRGKAEITTYTIDKHKSNSCRFNKRTEKKSSQVPCGVNGEVDRMVVQAMKEAQKKAEDAVRKFPLLSLSKREIIDALFYNGTYKLPGGKTINNSIWIDKINNLPDISLEGSRKVKEVVIGINQNHRGTITVQPYGVVLIEVRKKDH